MIALSMHYRMSIYVAMWSHNICEIAVENCENQKSAEKFVRTTSCR